MKAKKITVKKTNLNKIITFIALALFIASIPTKGFSTITGFSTVSNTNKAIDTNLYSEVTYIIDNNCVTCYDVTVNEKILTQGYGITVTGKKMVQFDSAEGKALVSKYKIAKIPTFITSSNASKSANLVGVWPQVGTVESDGTLVFRNTEVLQGNYELILANGSIALQEYVEIIPNTTIGSFYVSNETICTENGKPIIYFFGASTCPHCRWEKPVIGNVTAKFNDSIVYKELIDNFGSDQSVFTKFNPSGGVPTIVLGCKYYRIGSGESVGVENETKVLTALLCNLTNSASSECSAVSDLIEQI